jgi:hypothetical protein
LALLALASSPLRAASCAVPDSDQAWLASAIANWDRAADLLGRKVDALPWTIVYTESCVWQLAPREGRASVPKSGELRFNGQPVPIRSARYRKTFKLPNGSRQSAQAAAYTSLSKRRHEFFMMALPSVWKKDPRSMPGEDIETFAAGVFAHEITHTIHISAISRAIEKVGERTAVPESLNDDLLQGIFEKNPDYVAAYEREARLLADAVKSADDAAARDLARQALALADSRRTTYFTGEHAYFREVEPLFLNMEGVASWAAWKTGPPPGPEADPVKFAGRFWSQQEGLLLFLLLDRFDPAWRGRVFAAEVPSPFAMLKAAIE